MNEIIIYQNEQNQTQVEVLFEDETFWLSLNQIATLFERDKSVISRHFKNIFAEGELEKTATVAKNATVQNEGSREIKREVEYYNLDAILSVGYRVNSKRGTQFRQWATKRLADYLVEGYAINQKRLEERNIELKHLKNGISILRRAIEQQAQNIAETGNLVNLLKQFSAGLLLLDDYDHETLDPQGRTKSDTVKISKEQYLILIDAMCAEFSSDVFGKPKDASFDSSINQIYQSFNGSELYPTIEEKAATLLFLIVKNHSFIDGNKRIAAACFLYFLEQNGLLYPPDQSTPIIDNDALAAITLFAAVSKPDEMKTVKKVIISILNRRGKK